jgi:cytochrome c peroxidase
MKTKISFSLVLALIITLVIVSCKKTNPATSEEENFSDVPVLPAQPENYKASRNDHLATLGRVLFYDKNLSLNNSVSCASCHQQSKAFCDNLQFSPGLENVKTARNSPSIFGKNGRVFWDGRANSMNDLTLRPIKNHVEMKFEDVEALAVKISRLSYYPDLFRKAFGGSADKDTARIQLALAEFLKNFNFSNNKFARSEQGLESLNASEKLGKMVFFNKGRCVNCHHIEASKNVPFPGDSTDFPGEGYGFTNESHNIGLDEVYADNGVGQVSHNSEENGMFMIPALLNVEYTAPYMHDGRFKTLEEVVEHYNSGIKNHPNLDILLKDIDIMNMTEAEQMAIIQKYDKNGNQFLEPFELSGLPPAKLGLTAAEKKGLVDFLKTLSDPSIFKTSKFSNPFALK